jgi:hypothetical protein
MNQPQHSYRHIKVLFTLLMLGALSLVSCAENPAEPDPARTTESEGVSEFYTTIPSGSADDYYLMYEDEDDVEYSYFLDEDEYVEVRDNGGKHAKYKFRFEKIKNGHGYGDHNHMHVHRKGGHKYHGIYIGLKRRAKNWTDSLAITDSQKIGIDSAFRNFRQCSKATLDSFKVEFKPFRDEFRTEKRSILAQLDSGSITRDSARVLLDSAISEYEAKTDLLREALNTELKACRTELDADIKTILTPAQYDIWVRHRGW